MAGYRPNYSKEEQQRMIDYICRKQDFYSLRGSKYWKDMEESKEFDRTWQSLKEHFRKKVFPNLHLYKLNENDYTHLRAGYQSSQTKTKPVSKEDAFVYYMEDSDDE